MPIGPTLEVQEDLQVIFSSVQDEVYTKYYGQMSNQSSQTVNITTQGVYVPMNIIGTFDNTNSQGTSAPTTASFGIKNSAGDNKKYVVIATADVEIGNNKTAGWRLAVNGVLIAETTCTATTGTQNFAKLMTQWIVTLDDGDEISCYLANLSNTDNIQVDRSKIVAFTL